MLGRLVLWGRQWCSCSCITLQCRGSHNAQLWVYVRSMSTATAGGEVQFFVKHELQYPLFPPNPEVESTVETIWNKMNNSEAGIVLKEFRYELTKDIVNSLLVKLCSRRQYMTAYMVSQFVLHYKPYKHTRLEYETFLHFSCYTDKATHPFKHMAEKSSFAYERMLRSITIGNYVKRAVAMFDDMKKGKFVKTAEPYNLMTAMYLCYGQSREATKLFAEMKSSGIEPNSRTYKIILEYGYVMDKKERKKYKKELKEHLSKVGDAVLKGMEWRDTIVLQASLNRSSHVERLWCDMAEEGYVPDHYYYSAMEAFAMLGDADKFEELSSILKDRNGAVRPDHALALIMGYTMNGMMDEAEVVFQSLGSQVNHEIYNCMITGYMEAGDIEKGLEKFQEFRGAGFRPSMGAMLYAFDAYAANNDIDAAEELMKEIELGKYKQSAPLFNGMLKVYIASSKTEVPRLTERVKKISQNEETKQLLLKLEENKKKINQPQLLSEWEVEWY